MKHKKSYLTTISELLEKIQPKLKGWATKIATWLCGAIEMKDHGQYYAAYIKKPNKVKKSNYKDPTLAHEKRIRQKVETVMTRAGVSTSKKLYEFISIFCFDPQKIIFIN